MRITSKLKIGKWKMRLFLRLVVFASRMKCWGLSLVGQGIEAGSIERCTRIFNFVEGLPGVGPRSQLFECRCPIQAL